MDEVHVPRTPHFLPRAPCFFTLVPLRRICNTRNDEEIQRFFALCRVDRALRRIDVPHHPRRSGAPTRLRLGRLDPRAAEPRRGIQRLPRAHGRAHPLVLRPASFADHHHPHHLPHRGAALQAHRAADGRGRNLGRHPARAVRPGPVRARLLPVPLPPRIAGQHQPPEPVRTHLFHVHHRYGARRRRHP